MCCRSQDAVTQTARARLGHPLLQSLCTPREKTSVKAVLLFFCLLYYNQGGKKFLLKSSSLFVYVNVTVVDPKWLSKGQGGHRVLEGHSIGPCHRARRKWDTVKWSSPKKLRKSRKRWAGAQELGLEQLTQPEKRGWGQRGWLSNKACWSLRIRQWGGWEDLTQVLNEYICKAWAWLWEQQEVTIITYKVWLRNWLKGEDPPHKVRSKRSLEYSAPRKRSPHLSPASWTRNL